jgi:hypothetical protein
MALVKNPFEGLLSSRLLFSWFAMINPIFELEFRGKTYLPHLKSPMVDVFFQTMHLSNNELEVKNYGTTYLKCFKFKLQNLKLIRLN